MKKHRIRTFQLDERVVRKLDDNSVIVGIVNNTLILEEFGAPSLRGGWITQHCDNAELEYDEHYVGSYVGKIGNLVHVYWSKGDAP